jgi:hypothetical protein
MAGFKDFVDGVPLFASEIDGYLMRQTVMRFGTTTQLVNALTSGIRETGMLAWADSTKIVYLFDGTNWIPWYSPEFSFAPVFTAGGSAITFGNSIQNSWWRYSGGMVKWNFRLVVGSTANLGVGAYAWSMPVSTRTELDHHHIGQGIYYDVSADTTYHRAMATLGTTTSIGAVDSNGTRLGAAAPVAWANNDQFGFNMVYPPSTGTYL